MAVAHTRQKLCHCQCRKREEWQFGGGEERPRQAPKTKDRQKLITVVIHICKGTSNVAGNGSEGRKENSRKNMKNKEKRERHKKREK